jgi:DNA-binding IclR family transcriptional regulator
MLVTEGPQSLGQIASRSGLSKATVHRLLSALGYRSLVMQNSLTGDYTLGPGCIALADAVMRGTGLVGALARPWTQELSTATQETATVHVRVGSQRFCVDEVPSPQPLRFISGIGVAEPIHTGSAGKILLAYAADSVRQSILQRLKLVPVTKNTIVDRDALERELDKVRHNGYATSRGERIEGAVGLSVPILDNDGLTIAAFSILGPADRLPDEKLLGHLPLLRKCAENLAVSMQPQ